MFAVKPLTFLLGTATVALDLVILARQNGSADWGSHTTGFALGQIAVLAVWMVRGDLHRLLRASGFLLGTAALALAIKASPTDWTILFLYALAIFFAAVQVEWIHRLHGVGKNIRPLGSFRFSLMEYFGWTIVLAVVCVVGRQMRWEKIVQTPEIWFALLGMVTVPVVLIWMIRHDLRELSRYRLLAVVSGAILSGWYFSRLGASWIIATQTAYLMLCLMVLTWDHKLAETFLQRNQVGECDEQGEDLKIYSS